MNTDIYYHIWPVVCLHLSNVFQVQLTSTLLVLRAGMCDAGHVLHKTIKILCSPAVCFLLSMNISWLTTNGRGSNSPCLKGSLHDGYFIFQSITFVIVLLGYRTLKRTKTLIRTQPGGIPNGFLFPMQWRLGRKPCSFLYQWRVCLILSSCLIPYSSHPFCVIIILIEQSIKMLWPK